MTSPPRIDCLKSVLHVFQVKANKRALQRLCNEVFNTPSQSSVVCVPIDKYVFLQFGHIDWVGTAGSSAGVKEDQVLIHVPVAFTSARAIGLAYFTPFIWVDNPLSMAGGREVFGYPKSIGPISIPNVPKLTPPSLTLKGWKGDLEDHEWLRDQDQILVQPREPLDPSTGDLINIFIDKLDLNSGSRVLFRDWLAGRATEIFLKQFRATDSNINNNNACFQQILTARYTTLDTDISQLKFRFDLKIADSDSAKMVTTLGLAGKGAKPQKNQLFHTTVDGCLRMDIETIMLDYDQTLWQWP